MEEDDTTTSPNINAVESFINASMTSLNDTFFLPRITQNDESLLSPAPCLQSATPHNVINCKISEEVINAIRKQVLQDVQVGFNNKAVEFFHQVEDKLENIVDLKLNGSSYTNLQPARPPCRGNCNALDEKLKCFDERYDDFIDKYGKFNRSNDKKETLIETLENEILSVKADIVSLDQGLKHM